MDLKDLKLYASVYVTECDITKEDKKYFLKFIDESNEYDILNLLLLGKAEHVDEAVGKGLKLLFTELTPHGYILENINESEFLVELINKRNDSSFISEITLTTSDGGTAAQAFYSISKKINKLFGREPALSVGKWDIFLKNKDAQAVDGLAKKMFSQFTNAKSKMASMKSKAAEKGGEAAEYIKSHPKEAAMGLAAAAVVAIAAVVSTKIAKNYFTKAAKACKGKTGTEKTLCMQQYKVDAIKAQMKTLDDYKNYCKVSKNPSKCAKQIDKKKTELKIRAQKQMQKGTKKV